MILGGIARAMAALLALSASAAGQTDRGGGEEPCGTALALGLDVSSSVDRAEALLQTRGLAAAFRSPEVVDAILGGAGGGVMVAVYEWSGYFQQEVVVGWTWLGDRAAIEAFSDRLAGQVRRHDSWPTSLGRAVEFGAVLHGRSPRDCARRIIDISGDGPNNHGAAPDWYARQGSLDGLTVNGLAIAGGTTGTGDTAAYYRQHLIHGPGAFVEVARGFADYPRAIIRKLVRELQAPVASR